MKYWIEVSSEYRFDQKLKGNSGLYAPNTQRYINMLKHIRTGDIILHYIVSGGTHNKSYASSIVGLSYTDSNMIIQDTKITVDIKGITKLSEPIKKDGLKSINTKSRGLGKLINVNFQRYLTEISKEDLTELSKIRPVNKPHFQNII